MLQILLIVLAILYLLNPFDVVPDLALGWGWLDDLVILYLIWRYLMRARAASGRGAAGRRDQAPGADAQVGADAPWDPYRVLGVDHGAGQEEIKQAYRRLAAKYHPDKVDHLGEEFKALAEKRFKEIQAAYNELEQR
jgi:DnaJ-domain-containing protein 1